MGSTGVSVGKGVFVTVWVAVGRKVQVGRRVRVMVGEGVEVAERTGVRVIVAVRGRKVEVGRPEIEAGGNKRRRAMNIRKKTATMIKKAGKRGRAEGAERFMATQIIPEKDKIRT
jgi:hypothetical protein